MYANLMGALIKGARSSRIMAGRQDAMWVKMWKTNSAELRRRAVVWRKENAVTRVNRPSRLERARRLGYKAKRHSGDKNARGNRRHEEAETPRR